MIKTLVKDMSNERLMELMDESTIEKVQESIWFWSEMGIHDLMDGASGIDWCIGGRGEHVTIDDIDKAIIWLSGNKEILDRWQDGTWEKSIRSLRNISNNMYIVEDEHNLNMMQGRQEELLEMFEDLIFDELHSMYYAMYDDEAIEEEFLCCPEQYLDFTEVIFCEDGEVIYQ